jgi:hypothetical protein
MKRDNIEFMVGWLDALGATTTTCCLGRLTRTWCGRASRSAVLAAAAVALFTLRRGVVATLVGVVVAVAGSRLATQRAVGAGQGR